MKQINIIGGIAGISGYDSHTRNLANALDRIIPVRLSCQIPQGFELQLTDREVTMLKRKPHADEINLIITMPHMWRLYTTNKRNWAYCIWEGDKVPESFIPEFLNTDIEYIFVPSNHTKQAIINTNSDNRITNKIKIIPHGVNPDLFFSKEKPKKCTFIANKGFRNLEDRGGIQYLIKAYLEEFNETDNVELILKINPTYGIVDLNQAIKQLTNKTGKTATIKIDVNAYDYKKMAQLYNQGNVFVSTTRAEAYNLPCIEAMICGLPVLTTNFGGQTDYVDNDNGWIIGGEIKPVEHEVAYEGISWLEPSIEELRAKLRHIYENPEEVENKSIRAMETAIHHTWYDTAELIETFI